MREGISFLGGLILLGGVHWLSVFAQNIGVGTTTPQARLHVVAPSGFTVPIFQVEIEGSTNPYFVIQPDGKVGVGLVNPSEVLDVSGNIQFSGALMPGGNAGTAGQVLVSQGPGVAPQWQNASSIGDNWGSQAAQTQPPIVGDGTATNPIGLQNGTTQGNILVWDGTQWQITSAPYDSVCSAIQVNYVPKWAGTELCNSLIYDDGIRVGIGTATPQTKLHIYDTSLTTVLTISAQFRPWIIFHQTGTNAGYAMGIEIVGTDSVFRLNYDRPAGTAFQNIFTASNNGFFGLRVPTPQAPLHLTNEGGINGEVLRVENPSIGKVLYIYFNDTIGLINNPDGVVYFEVSGDETFMTGGHLISDADGSRLLGNSIHRWQEVWAANGVIQTSTKLEKKDIKPLGYGLETVLALKPITYKWTKFPDTLTHIGFIAEDVYKVIPEVVRFGDKSNTIKGMSYSELIPVLTKAIQELYSEVQMLRHELDLLKQNK